MSIKVLIKEKKGIAIYTLGVYIIISFIYYLIVLNMQMDINGVDSIKLIKEKRIEGLILTIYNNSLCILHNKRPVFIYLFGLSIVFATLIINNKVSRKRLEYLAYYDYMTGILNRRAGLEQVKRIYKNMKKNESISICFVDINNLKEVNDNLGHEIGDELILTVTDIIKKNISKKDFIIRIGGDEFLIIFDNLNIKETDEIWENIIEDVRKINNNEKRNYVISLSHGIEILLFSNNKNDEMIGYIINLADKKMYREKEKIKKDLKTIRKLENIVL